MRHRIVIEAHAPLVFSERKPAGQFAPSFGYVPGIALWGALGMRLQETPEPIVRFGPALPARSNDRSTRVLPATAQSCKLHGGFRADEGQPHGVFDTLIDRVCCEELQPAGLTYDPRCPECLRRAERPPGSFYAIGLDGRWRTRGVSRRILTRVAIDRRRGTAAENLLYSPIALSEVATFPRGDEVDYELARFVGLAWGLNERARAELARVGALGGRLSSGLGRVSISVEEDDSPDDLDGRLRRLNERFAARWALIGDRLIPRAAPEWSPGAWRVFSVGLQSDAILHDQGWRPSIVFSADHLAAQTGLNATLVRAEASGRAAGGWSARWNRQRPTVLATLAGSVYLFRSQASEEQIVHALRRLEAEGAGQWRAQGYGIVRCCDEFHGEATGAAI